MAKGFAVFSSHSAVGGEEAMNMTHIGVIMSLMKGGRILARPSGH
jgi:hypothetical protein